MTRRTFSKIVGVSCSRAVISARSVSPMDRVAMTTSTFGAWFDQTRTKDQQPARTITLLEIPEFYADRFKCHNLEFWNKHFESQTPAYIAELKRKIRAANSKLIGIQIDGPYELGSPDEASRRKSIDFVKTWIDTAAAVGARAARANTGNGSPDGCIESYRDLSRYAKGKKVLLLTENHGGISLNIDVLLRILRGVGGGNFQLEPDFGNFLNAETRYSDLQRILPYAKHVISAKATEIGEDGSHVQFDFNKCMKISEAAGFPGYYSAEYWAPKAKRTDYETIADWMIQHVLAGLSKG